MEALLKLEEAAIGYGLEFLEKLPLLAVALIVWMLFWFISKLTRKAAQTLAGRLTGDKSLQSLFGTLAHVLTNLVGLFAAATVVFPGLKVGDLVGVLGLTSVAIGFAFKNIFENFLAGIIILTQRPFRIGDQIATDSGEGKVESINVRSTIIRTFDNQRVIIPNSELFTKAVVVRTAFPSRRSTFNAGIAYGENIETARAVMMEAVASCEGVLAEPAPGVFLLSHDDSAVSFEVVYWTASGFTEVLNARDRVGSAIKKSLDAADIEIPFPQRVVHTRPLSSSA